VEELRGCDRCEGRPPVKKESEGPLEPKREVGKKGGRNRKLREKPKRGRGQGILKAKQELPGQKKTRTELGQ